ncbi:hypothetical protein J5X84_28530 [Streptosporangiaceae bacterium NEAU-GS5]|nr:hypothetical protein [Streptosporangiaceae bacterium NEAU-GS5]
MSLLEDNYRSVLRLLPAAYRAQREEEMVSAFMESVGDADDPDVLKPSWAEIASVAALSVRIRLGGVGAAPRWFAWGETVRLVALLGLVFQTVISCVYAGGLLLLYAKVHSPGAHYEPDTGPGGAVGPIGDIAQTLAGGLWIAALAALLYGRVHAAKVVALIAVALQLYFVAAIVANDPYWWETLQRKGSYALLSLVSITALTAGFHRDAPPVRRGGWLSEPALGAGALLSVAVGVAGVQLDRRPWSWAWFDAPGLAGPMIVIAGAAYLGVHAYAPDRRTPAWPLALAILAAPVLCARVAGLNFSSDDAITRAVNAVMLGQSLAVTFVGLVLLVVGARALPASERVADAGPLVNEADGSA